MMRRVLLGAMAVVALAEGEGMRCPVGNAQCPNEGCAPVEAGKGIDCCGDGTACAEGYRCDDNVPGHGAACSAVADGGALAMKMEGAGEEKPMPMGTAGWELRYHLCRPGGLPLHMLDLPSVAARFPYYSSVGPIDQPPPSTVEVAFIVQHGMGRNADDYYCSALEAVAMSGLPPGRAAVYAPRFMEPPDKPTPGTIYWNGSYPNGCWRCGGESDPAAAAGQTTSSFAVLDRMVRLLLATPRLRTIVIAGHSSGGQIVQRHAIFTHLPLTDARVRWVPANPSSYAYLDARRWINGSLVVPSDSQQAKCPAYDDWHFGLASGLPPYARARPGGTRAALAAFAHRDVHYLQGHNDTCDCNPSTPGCACVSHGLETTCADELMGPYRLARGRLYYAALQSVYKNHTHMMHEVPNVGHDHSLIWQSREGLSAIFG